MVRIVSSLLACYQALRIFFAYSLMSVKLALPTQKRNPKFNSIVCTSFVPDCSTRIFVCTGKTFNLEPFQMGRVNFMLELPTLQLFSKPNCIVCTSFVPDCSTRIFAYTKKFLNLDLFYMCCASVQLARPVHCHANLNFSFLIIYIMVILYRRKFCDGHIILSFRGISHNLMNHFSTNLIL